jgi:hypothetical protein
VKREHVLDAVAEVCGRLQKAGAHHGMWWAGRGTPQITILRPVVLRDDAQAIALAMDAGVDRDDLLLERDLVKGPVFVEDTWAPGPVRVDVIVLHGEHPDFPAAGVPVQRSGDDDAVVEQRLEDGARS